MRTIVLMILGALAITFTCSVQAHPNCDQIDEMYFCAPYLECDFEIDWITGCVNEVRQWRCHWFPTEGQNCPEDYGNAQYCNCGSAATPGNACDCLLEGTPIRMADGSTKPVEEIQVGDRVLAYDESSTKMKTSEVTSIHKPYIVNHYFIINEELSATKNHPVLSEGKWLSVGDLSVGDVLTNPDGWDIEIYTFRKVNEKVKVYNFQVEAETYVANDFIVHNKEDCEEYVQYHPDE
ncbi:MAG: hypothetical protein KJ970_10690 [Candidatus Eisenbacteria bacterium]|uniref:Hint domain-containing protein n=1 Tax=Eiseniibacteriota bacterium TaxID=2212470 RepID=A0A948RWS2_UNCEI|nr:hypothetical protein [Candidatus Eisenbacteria bacterium]MBU1950173.1 hypothetical protein [Candidatus Eisenbacteria bacterium]MBU2691381.1 hypothetical protein [Candidatus Eisenbacteria bacterium]